MATEKLKFSLIILVIIGLVLPNFAYLQTQGTPETFEQLKELGGKAFEAVQKLFPEAVKKAWQEEVLPIWEKMYNWLKENIWDPYLGSFLKKEIEKRKPTLEEEFEKEKKEMKESAKEEVPKATKSLWEKFKELISTK